METGLEFKKKHDEFSFLVHKLLQAFGSDDGPEVHEEDLDLSEDVAIVLKDESSHRSLDDGGEVRSVV